MIADGVDFQFCQQTSYILRLEGNVMTKANQRGYQYHLSQQLPPMKKENGHSAIQIKLL